MSILYLVKKNLLSHKIRSALLILCIFIAFIVYGVLKSFEQAMNAGVELSGANRLVTVNKINFTQPLPYAYYNRVRNISGVKNVSFARWFGGYYQDPKNFIVTFAVDPSSYLEIFTELVVKPEEKDAFLKDKKGLLVGRNIANKYGWKIGDNVPISSNIFFNKKGGHTWDFNLRGIYDGEQAQTDTNQVILHYDYFNLSSTFGKDSIGWLIILTEDASLNEQVAKKIDSMFSNSAFETRTASESAFNKAFIEQIGNISLIIQSVVTVAFLTILMIVGNTMYLAIEERVKEIAILKTLGFKNRIIFNMILSETLLLTLIGGIPAIICAYAIIKALNFVVGGFLPGLIMPMDVIIYSLLWMILLSMLTGIIPAYNAVKLNIITALNKNN
ncbi:MAG: ABC transporter permease [Legionellales bacterium]|nr:ABC transporter permease [Legionellales bacterium]